jgi:oxepin-CoA hydrolase/3-oxo-5,6-dehydrosuberyl-CoA semialdehyde dehydrogenase
MKTTTFIAETLPQLLAKLQPDTPAQWGMMSAQHMVEHLSTVLMLGAGKINVPILLPEEKIQANYERTIVQKMPIPKNLRVAVVPATPGPLEFPNLSEAVAFTLACAQEFLHFWENNPQAKVNHPVLGSLHQADWLYFQCLHLQHHLSQFGLWDEANA